MVLLLGVLLTTCSGAAGDGEISVSQARVPVPAGANGAAYMTLTNRTGGDDRLVGASTDIAETVELHQTTTSDGATSMQHLDGVQIPSGGETVLEPGGLHLMLIGVTDPLAEGDTVDITLTFDNAGEQTVTAEVVTPGDAPATDMASEGMDMGADGRAWTWERMVEMGPWGARVRITNQMGAEVERGVRHAPFQTAACQHTAQGPGDLRRAAG